LVTKNFKHSLSSAVDLELILCSWLDLLQVGTLQWDQESHDCGRLVSAEFLPMTAMTVLTLRLEAGGGRKERKERG
jgi:hypothetical protein